MYVEYVHICACTYIYICMYICMTELQIADVLSLVECRFAPLFARQQLATLVQAWCSESGSSVDGIGLKSAVLLMVSGCSHCTCRA